MSSKGVFKVEDNLSTWTNYTWDKQGDEWSTGWGGTAPMWWGSLFPRLRAYLPAATILEIAPGFGRCTQYLKDFCQQLLVVDLTPRCIEACQQRFAPWDHIRYFVNDGKSLAQIPDRSLDFVFSYDSLVHADADVLQAYIAELAQKLKPNGVGMLHHSNMAEYLVEDKRPVYDDGRHRRIPLSLDISRLYAQGCQMEEAACMEAIEARAREFFGTRTHSMNADLFVAFCQQAGVHCFHQELISWCSPLLSDSFSWFTLPGSDFDREYSRVWNFDWSDELTRIKGFCEGAELTAPEAFWLSRQG